MFRQRTWFSYGIILIQVLLFVAAIGISVQSSFPAVSLRGIFTPSFESLYRLGMGGAIPWKMGRWWTVGTGPYLHGSLLHLVFSILWLGMITPLVISLFGPGRFFIIYSMSGVGGALVTILAGTPFFVGASGAILGLFGALIYYGSHEGGTFGTTLFKVTVVFSLLAFLYGFITPGVDNWGHLGGLATGILAAFLVGYRDSGLSYRLGKILVWICCLGMITSFSLMIYFLL